MRRFGFDEVVFWDFDKNIVDNPFLLWYYLRKEFYMWGNKVADNLFDINLLSEAKEDKEAPVHEDFTEKLQQFFDSINIKGTVNKRCVGPVVTVYGFQFPKGVKLPRLSIIREGLADYIPVKDTRLILADIDLITIEILNKKRKEIRLKNIIDTEFSSKFDLNLIILLGLKVNSLPVYLDLTKATPIFLTGTEGSGKTNWIRSVILSIMYRYTPEECKLLMIDPTFGNWAKFGNFPHLLKPVIKDSQKTLETLDWLRSEIWNRINVIFNKSDQNSFENYNKKAKRNGEQTFPYIVCIIDEIAKFMVEHKMLAKNMIEEILLLGKIVGISFIIASRFDSIRRIIPKDLQDTFPSWLTFHMDEDIYPPCRDVHDTWKTLPCGDMLYKAPEHRSIRLHTPFVSDKEFKSVLSFLKKK